MGKLYPLAVQVMTDKNRFRIVDAVEYDGELFAVVLWYQNDAATEQWPALVLPLPREARKGERLDDPAPQWVLDGPVPEALFDDPTRKLLERYGVREGPRGLVFPVASTH